jgi:hypothetical protein
MGVYFVAKNSKEFDSEDKSLKLGRLNAGFFLVDGQARELFYKLISELNEIDGIELLKVNQDVYSIRLNASKLNDSQLIIDILIGLNTNLSNKKIASSIIQTIEGFTGLKMPSQENEHSASPGSMK